MTTPTTVEAFDDFWEAGALNSLTFDSFAARVEAYEHDPDVVDPLSTSAEPHRLPQRRDRLSRLMAKRASSRSFTDSPMSERQLGLLMTALIERGDGRRQYPTAGGLGAVEVYCLLNRVDTSLGRIAARYRPATHSLAPVVALPSMSDLDRLCTLEGADPSLILLFAIRTHEMLARYGPRGGRFALIEVGHACHSVALRLIPDGLSGVQLGGTLDSELEALLGIGSARARLALGYAIG